MNDQEFSDCFPTLSGLLGGVFQYPDGKSDVQLAICATQEPIIQKQYRQRVLIDLIGECDQLVPRLEDVWELLARSANRSFPGPDSAKQWLLLLASVWKNELNELNKR